VTLRPDWAKAWGRKGHAFFHLDRPQEAFEAYSHACRLHPKVRRLDPVRHLSPPVCHLSFWCATCAPHVPSELVRTLIVVSSCYYSLFIIMCVVLPLHATQGYMSHMLHPLSSCSLFKFVADLLPMMSVAYLAFSLQIRR
jgi:hypothetical protein